MQGVRTLGNRHRVTAISLRNLRTLAIVEAAGNLGTEPVEVTDNPSVVAAEERLGIGILGTTIEGEVRNSDIITAVTGNQPEDTQLVAVDTATVNNHRNHILLVSARIRA